MITLVSFFKMWPSRTLDVVHGHNFEVVIFVVLLPIIICQCGRPITPDNGSIEAYHNTTEGAEIFFRCNPMFVPAGRMRAMCGADGRWNPDPATLVCVGVLVVCLLYGHINK